MTDTTYALMKIVLDEPRDNGWCHMGLKDREIITHILGRKTYLTNTSDNIFKGKHDFGCSADIIPEYIFEIKFNDNFVCEPRDIIDLINIEYDCYIPCLIGKKHSLTIDGESIKDYMFIKNTLILSIMPKNICCHSNYECSVKLKEKNPNIKSIVCRSVGIISSYRKQIHEELYKNQEQHMLCDS